jgi:hypothetical protein
MDVEIGVDIRSPLYAATKRRSKDLSIMAGMLEPSPAKAADPEAEAKYAEYEAWYAGTVANTHALFNPNSASPPRRKPSIARGSFSMYDQPDLAESRSPQLVRRNSKNSTSIKELQRRASLPAARTSSAADIAEALGRAATPSTATASKEAMVRRTSKMMARARRASI